MLIESRAGHNVSPRRSRGRRILGHTIGSQLHRCHIPLTHEVLQLLLHDLRRGLTQLYHGSKAKERRHPVSSTTPSYFLDLFLYLSFFSTIEKETGRWWEIVREDVGCAGATTSFIAPRCGHRGGKAAGLHRHSKTKLTCHPTPRMTCLLHRGVWKPSPKWVPQLSWGPQSAGFKDET
jgi:hypothetical protein